MQHSIVFIETPTEEDYAIIANGISQFGAQRGTVGLDTFFFIAYDENRTIIAAMSGYDNFGPAEISGLWIDERYRQQGYGYAMLAKAEAWARQKGIKSLTLFTLKEWPACAWYQKNGFVIEYERPNHVNNSTGCYLIKKLD